MQVVENRMKKALTLLFLLFFLHTFIVCFHPVVTQWDESVIFFIQDKLKDIPVWIPMLLGTELYATMIALPLIIGNILFFRKYLIIDMIILSSAPLVAYIFNYVFKYIIHRQRPSYELQLATHSGHYSYVSSHTLVTIVLWGMVIYYLNLYCKNKLIKNICISISAFWILTEGFGRIWLGVHNPTDVFGAYFLGAILLVFYIKLTKLIGGKC